MCALWSYTNVHNELIKVKKGLIENKSGDLVAMDIRQILYYIGTITGEISSDELLGNIFAKFCIGSNSTLDSI